MARRVRTKIKRDPIPDVIRQADPTPAQRASFDYEQIDTANPDGETGVQGVKGHKACRKVPTHTWLLRRGSLTAIEHDVAEWYAGQWAIARMGLTRDSLDMQRGGGNGTRSEAVAHARDLVSRADRCIPHSCAITWQAIMQRGESVAEYTGGASRARHRAVQDIKAAAKAIRLGVSGIA